MRRFLLVWALGVLCLCAGMNARAATFTFTKVADTADGYSALSLPAVNSTGTVAFSTELANGHVFTSTAGVISPVFDGNVKDPSINDLGQLGFISGQNIYKLSGGVLTPIAVGALPDGSQLFQATISNSGNVYFTYHDGQTSQLFKFGNGGTVTTLSSIPIGVPVFGRPAVSSNDHAAINATLPVDGSGGVSLDLAGILSSGGVYTELNPGHPSQTGHFTFFGDVDVNAKGTVVFNALLDTITNDLDTYDNGIITKIAGGAAIPAINDQGMVAALFTSGVKSLKVGFGAPSDTVLSVGDAFMGSTVTDLKFSHEGLSDGNYLAFSATLADGRTGIYLTAVPEPAILGLLAPVILLRRKRR